jgi:chemotaxis signal transduction protein
MMRLALFEISAVSCSVPLDKVLHVLTEPNVFVLPLLRGCFSGGLIYQGQLVPLLKGVKPEAKGEVADPLPAFVLVCEAEFGLIGVPADRIIRITKNEEVDSDAMPRLDSHQDTYQINNCEYRFLDLNRVVEDPDFTLCGLKVSRRLA